MKKRVIFTTMAIFLIGCGGGNSSSNASYEGTMDISESYTLYSGDKVVKTSDDASVKITHVDGQDESVVVLVTGSADIIRQ